MNWNKLLLFFFHLSVLTVVATTSVKSWTTRAPYKREDIRYTPGYTQQGGFCETDHLCWSGICSSGVCAADTPAKGKVGASGACVFNRHCWSGYCHNGTCATDSPNPGKIGAEGPCLFNQQCWSEKCEFKKCTRDRPVKEPVAEGFRCTDDSDCFATSYCKNQLCFQKRLRGETCYSYRDCLYSTCMNSRCQ